MKAEPFINFLLILSCMLSSNTMPNLPKEVIITSIPLYRSNYPLIYLDWCGVFNYFVYLNVEVVVLDFEVIVASKDALEFACLNASDLEQAPDVDVDVDAATFAVYDHFLVSFCLFVDVLRAKEAAPHSLPVTAPYLVFRALLQLALRIQATSSTHK